MFDKNLAHLPQVGRLKIQDNYCYLDIDNRYIHETFPLVQNYFGDKSIVKPDYFSAANSIGAHISIAYPDEIEKIHLDPSAFDSIYFFRVNQLFSVKIQNKYYYALSVDSPQLLDLRVRLGLPGQLNFKGCFIGFHITVANSNKIADDIASL